MNNLSGVGGAETRSLGRGSSPAAFSKTPHEFPTLRPKSLPTLGVVSLVHRQAVLGRPEKDHTPQDSQVHDHRAKAMGRGQRTGQLSWGRQEGTGASADSGTAQAWTEAHGTTGPDPTVTTRGTDTQSGDPKLSG